MPTIPVYDTQVAPQDIQQTQTGVGMNHSGDLMKESAQNLENINQKFAALRNAHEESDATVGLHAQLSDIETRASNDQDFKNSPKYKDEINKAVAASASKITDPLLRTKAQESFTLNGFSTWNNVNNDFRKKEIESYKATVDTQDDSNMKGYIATTDPRQKQLFWDNQTAALDTAGKIGAYNADEIAKKKMTMRNRWDTAEFQFDVETNPKMAEEKLMAGDYKGIDTPDERTKARGWALSMQERQKKLIDLQTKTEQINNAMNTTSMIASGKFDQIKISDVNKMIITGKYSPEYGEALTKAITSPDDIDPEAMSEGNGTVDKSAFYNYMTALFDSGSPEEINKNVANALNGGADGRVSRAELLLIAKAAIKHNSDHTKPEGKQASVQTKGVLETLGSWVNFLAPKDAAKTQQAGQKAVVEAFISGSNPKEAADKFMQTTIMSEHPETAMYDEAPNYVFDNNSMSRLLLPRPTTLYGQRVHNPKTGALEPNPAVKQNKAKQ